MSSIGPSLIGLKWQVYDISVNSELRKCPFRVIGPRARATISSKDSASGVRNNSTLIPVSQQCHPRRSPILQLERVPFLGNRKRALAHRGDALSTANRKSTSLDNALGTCLPCLFLGTAHTCGRHLGSDMHIGSGSLRSAAISQALRLRKRRDN